MEKLDVVIIGGDIPKGVAGKEIRDEMRLSIEGQTATLGFLEEYFLTGRDAAKATSKMKTKVPPFVSINGPYLNQFLGRQGLRTALIPILTPLKKRFLELLEQEPVAVVISTTFLSIAEEIDRIATLVKTHAPNTIVIAGGIKIWKSYQKKVLLNQKGIGEDIFDAVSRENYFLDMKRTSPVDYFIISATGENTLATLLKSLKNKKDVSSLPNLAYYHDGAWHINPIEPEPPAEVKVDWNSVQLMFPKAYLPVQAGVGCKFRCAFCDFWGLREFRMRTVESIIEEISTMPVVEGYRNVNFTDDNLFALRGRTRQLCEGILKSGLKLKWRSFMRIDVVTEEIADMMAQSGCVECILGIESGDAGQLRRMKKGLTPEKILRGVNTLNRYGVNTESSFIIGFPGETSDSVQNTINMINTYETGGPGIPRYIVFLFGVFPLSRIAGPESREKYQLKGYKNQWSHATMDSERATELIKHLHDSIKPEVSPVYLEIGELPGLTGDQRKAVYQLRTRIKRAQRGLIHEPMEPLWDQLENIILDASNHPAA